MEQALKEYFIDISDNHGDHDELTVFAFNPEHAMSEARMKCRMFGLSLYNSSCARETR